MNGNSETIAKARRIWTRTRKVFLATADPAGFPHIAVGTSLDAADGGVSLTLWPCPVTMKNLTANPRLSVVCYDPENDEGVELTGTATKVRDIEITDGIALREEHKIFPQVERSITVRVESAQDLRRIETEKI